MITTYMVILTGNRYGLIDPLFTSDHRLDFGPCMAIFDFYVLSLCQRQFYKADYVFAYITSFLIIIIKPHLIHYTNIAAKMEIF